MFLRRDSGQESVGGCGIITFQITARTRTGDSDLNISNNKPSDDFYESSQSFVLKISRSSMKKEMCKGSGRKVQGILVLRKSNDQI